MRYFKDCETAEDVKQLFKKLCKELHPDMNPGRDTTAAFQEMYNEYEAAFERLKTRHVNAKGETYEKATAETAKEYADLIVALLKIPGLIVELCGSWLWVTGNTYPARDELKAMRFKFSNKKAAWYFHFEPYRKRGKSELTLDDIRQRFGSVQFQGKEANELPA